MSRSAVLDDAQWALISAQLPLSAGRAGRPFRVDRRVVEGIIYRYRCGIAWRDVPAEFEPWQTLWKRHRRYSGAGTGDRLLATLLTDAGDRGMMDWAVSVDSTINRANQHATNLARITGGSVELHEFARRASCIMRSAVPAAGYPRRSAPWSTGRADRWCC